MRRITFWFLALMVAACGSTPTPTVTGVAPTEVRVVTSTVTPPVAEATPSATETITLATASGLKYIELKAGEGPAPQVGDFVTIHYIGQLMDGRVFVNSYTRNKSLRFGLGQKQVIAGLEEGVALMRPGGKARLIIPAELAYGARGQPGLVPPDAKLIFEVELLSVQAGAPAAPQTVNEAYYVKTLSGLKYYDLRAGPGLYPQAGQEVWVQYTGWLSDGKKFDSSVDRGQPVAFIFGVDPIIPGWEEGLATMRVGGIRQLVIPPELAYGANGVNGLIPPNATLIYEVELLAVQ